MGGYSWSMIDRIVEREATRNPDYRRRLDAIGKPRRSLGRAMSDEQLLEKLRSFGLEVDRALLGEWCRKAPSVQELSEELRRTRPLKLCEMDEDWLWICLVVLWERWFPGLPSFESIDDKMQAGYDAVECDQARACELWLGAWQDILALMRSHHIETVGEFDDEFGGTQCMSNWIQDFTMQLWNAGLDDPRFLRERVAVCGEALRRWPEADPLLVENLKGDMAEASFGLGAAEQAASWFQQWLDDDPQWGWGWVRWSDWYAWRSRASCDPEEAKRILMRGLAVPGVRDRPDLLERLADLHDEAGEEQAAAKLRAEIENLRSDSARVEISQAGSVLRAKTTLSFGEEGLPVSELGNLGRALRGQSLGQERIMPQVGRNAPCPCGSGRKYKKCCGRPRRDGK